MKNLLPIAIAAGVGAVSVDLVPGLIGRYIPMLNTGVMSYVTKGGTLFLGYKVAKKFGGHQAAVGFVAGGSAKIIYDLAAGPIMSLMLPAPAVTTAGIIDSAGMSGYDDIADDGVYGSGIF